jgi:hypothetical protein
VLINIKGGPKKIFRENFKMPFELDRFFLGCCALDSKLSKGYRINIFVQMASYMLYSFRTLKKKIMGHPTILGRLYAFRFLTDYTKTFFKVY